MKRLVTGSFLNLLVITLATNWISAPVAGARSLTSHQAEQLREALIYSASVHHFVYHKLDEATSCMIERLKPGLKDKEFRWVIRYYRNEMKRAEIDEDPYRLLDWLSDIGDICLKAAQ